MTVSLLHYGVGRCADTCLFTCMRVRAYIQTPLSVRICVDKCACV